MIGGGGGQTVSNRGREATRTQAGRYEFRYTDNHLDCRDDTVISVQVFTDAEHMLDSSHHEVGADGVVQHKVVFPPGPHCTQGRRRALHKCHEANPWCLVHAGSCRLSHHNLGRQTHEIVMWFPMLLVDENVNLMKRYTDSKCP